MDAPCLAFLVRQSVLQREEEAERTKSEEEAEEAMVLQKEEAEDDESAACSAVPAAGVDDLPPRRLSTVIRLGVMGTGVIRADDGRIFTFRPTLMSLTVGWRVSFCVRRREAYHVVWETDQ